MDMQNLTEEMNSTNVGIDPNTGTNNQKIVPSKFQSKTFRKKVKSFIQI